MFDTLLPELFIQFIHGLTWQVDEIKKRFLICSGVIDSNTDANSRC